MQVDYSPTVDACTRLLRALPAFGAFKRVLRDSTSVEVLGWLGALNVIARHEDGIRASQIADILHQDLSVASRSVTHLVELGYVSRTRDPSDGRASIVHLAPAGRERLDSITAKFAQDVSGRLHGWSDEDVDTFTSLLRRFGATLEHAATNDTAKDLA